MDIEDAAKAQLEGERIRVSRLAEFRFKSGVKRYWPGMAKYENPADLDDYGRMKTWEPTMGIGNVTGIAQSHNASAPELQFELSGVDPAFIEKALGAVSEYFGQVVIIYWQFWTPEWEPIGIPKALTWGLMRSLISKRTATEAGTGSSIILTAETPFEGRSRAPGAYLTDRDQKTRHPGDRMLEQVAGLEAREIRWPDF